MCGVEPKPPEAYESCGALLRTKAVNSLNVRGGTEGWSTSNCGVEPITAIGAKSRAGSYGTFLKMSGATTMLVCGDTSHV